MSYAAAHRWACLFIAVGFLLAAAPTAGLAQNFSFGISTGGHHHHHGWHHGCWHGPCWGPWYGPSFGVIYAPPPVIRERVVYVDPPRASSWSPPANAAVAAAPAKASSEADFEARITIRNAAGVRLPVTFLLDGQDLQLADGSSQTFVGSARRTITYDRGGRFGSTQQDLVSGDYEFRVTPTGWDLARRPEVPPPVARAARANALPSSN